MKNRVAFLLIAGLAGCTAQAPHCLVSGDSDVVGTWRYRGDRTSSAICRPAALVFHTDGSFEASYDGCELNASDDHVAPPSSNELAGTWRAGDFCADRLFFPGVVIETEPGVPNTLKIVKLGNRLAIVGGDSGFYDASYYREPLG